MWLWKCPESRPVLVPASVVPGPIAWQPQSPRAKGRSECADQRAVKQQLGVAEWLQIRAYGRESPPSHRTWGENLGKAKEWHRYTGLALTQFPRKRRPLETLWEQTRSGSNHQIFLVVTLDWMYLHSLWNIAIWMPVQQCPTLCIFCLFHSVLSKNRTLGQRPHFLMFLIAPLFPSHMFLCLHSKAQLS